MPPAAVPGLQLVLEAAPVQCVGRVTCALAQLAAGAQGGRALWAPAPPPTQQTAVEAEPNKAAAPTLVTTVFQPLLSSGCAVDDCWDLAHLLAQLQQQHTQVAVQHWLAALARGTTPERMEALQQLLLA
jgi:hypothetical protein